MVGDVPLVDHPVDPDVRPRVAVLGAGAWGTTVASLLAARNETTIWARERATVDAIEPHDSVERYSGLGVECLMGEAMLIDPWTVAVNGQRLTAQNIVLATGAAPLVPPIPGLLEAPYYTSDTLWELREQPKRLVNVIKCTNPRCITSIEEGCDHIFALTPSGRYRCIYCEQEFRVKP